MAKRVKMDVSNRAKQFAPFAALKGFEEAIKAKERVVIPKVELTEESMEEIDEKLQSIHQKDIVTITYYADDSYLKMTGMVSKVDKKENYIQVVDTRIPFKDIRKIDITWE